jgi:Peptidase family M28
VDYPTGQKLRDWLSLGPVRIRTSVQCRTFVGYGQNVLATIAGSLSEESVFVLAHSSTGSRPGANCASGAALLTETARALNRLILAGELPRPRRSIKFLLMTEGLGSYNYLQDHADELSRIKASYCLESVGHSQRKINGTLYFARAPDSTPSFVNDHFDAVLERLPKHWGWVGRDEPDISPVVVSQVPYTPWSDNSTWATHGVPSALFMSWPDEYFHSQLLTVDVTDPIVFAYAGAMVAGAAYEVADAGAREAHWLAHWLYAKSAARLHREEQSALWAESSDQARDWTGRRLNYLCQRDCEALASLSGLVAAEELPSLTAKIAALQKRLLSLRDLILTSRGF